MKRVLVACEYSGVVRDAFIKMGCEAISCDLLPTESDGPHYQGNILDILYQSWDLLIAHPPCIYIANSGVRHLHSVPSRNGKLPKIHGEERWKLMREGCEFFNLLQNAPINRICIENPIPHKYSKEIIGNYTQLIQPWQFSHNEVKATCLWLKNLPKLVPTNIVSGREARIHKMPPSKDRSKLRSRTFDGIAKGMAEQWSPLL